MCIYFIIKNKPRRCFAQASQELQIVFYPVNLNLFGTLTIILNSLFYRWLEGVRRRIACCNRSRVRFDATWMSNT
jgi:hypothetical protein